jgi:hypothetical protein
MTLEWTLTAAVGLMVGISLGVLVQLRYVVLMDKKIEHIIERIARIELRTEQEVVASLKKRTAKVRARPVKRRKAKRGRR